MKVWSVWTPGPGAGGKDPVPVVVPQSVSWWVILFGWLALIVQGAVIAGLLAGTAAFALAWILHKTAFASGALMGLNVALGVFFSDIRGWELRLRGYVPAGVVTAPDRDTALLRYMDQAAAGTQVVAPPTVDGARVIPDPFAGESV